MSSSNSKYPMQATSGRSGAKYSGSGALHDRFDGDSNLNKSHAMARGSDRAVIEGKFNQHNKPAGQVPGTKESSPGTVPKKPMKLGAVHGFRAHGVTEKNSNTALRFSGSSSAHQIGKNKPTFKSGRYETAGFTGAGQNSDIAGTKSLGPTKDKLQKKAKSQPTKKMSMKDSAKK